MAASLDVEGVFNNVGLNAITDSLRTMNIQLDIVNCIPKLPYLPVARRLESSTESRK